jgi:hypothetical protein
MMRILGDATGRVVQLFPAERRRALTGSVLRSAPAAFPTGSTRCTAPR